jgi:glycosyltransferase involved in cell wall biosynthesis
MPVKRDSFFHMTLPNKLFDYMAGARPVIAAVPPGEIQDLVERAEAGLAIPPEDEIKLAAALLDLRDDPDTRRRFGENGRRYVMEHYLRSHLAARLTSVLDTVLQEKGKTTAYESTRQHLPSP